MKNQDNFVFIYTHPHLQRPSHFDIRLPLNISLEELTCAILTLNDIPDYLEEDVRKNLQQFIEEKELELRKTNTPCLEDIDRDKIVEHWTKLYQTEINHSNGVEELSRDEVFSQVYHNLIHSPALQKLLNREKNYASSVSHLHAEKLRSFEELDLKQSYEMENAVKNLGLIYTEEQVNQLAQRHFDNIQLLESKTASEMSNLQETQKREYRDFLMSVQDGGADANENDIDVGEDLVSNEQETSRRLEESFTIQLGAQLKTTHNLRVVCANISDLLLQSNRLVAPPQRLQVAMSLYSNALCGVALLVDSSRIQGSSGMGKEFAELCQQSTDFHFRNLSQQLLDVETHVAQVDKQRRQLRHFRSVAGDQDEVRSMLKTQSTEGLSCGDFYITHHSNLSECHVVFHLITDESVRSADLSSRHPIVLGYRNIIKTCFRHDIRTITLPLFIVHEMSEEMTIAWCMKRAELVFKCVKGFMMELVPWCGQDSRNVQFHVPRSISEDTFAAICNLLPTIFRMSKTIVVKT